MPDTNLKPFRSWNLAAPCPDIQNHRLIVCNTPFRDTAQIEFSPVYAFSSMSTEVLATAILPYTQTYLSEYTQLTPKCFLFHIASQINYFLVVHFCWGWVLMP